MPATPETKPQDPPVLSPTEARQGFRGRHVLWVLVISLGLIVVIYAVMVGGIWNGRLSQPGGQTRASQSALTEAKGFQAPPSQPRESENPQTTPTITPNPTNGRGQGQ
ncbi:MAG TPA: hypothetical protein VGM25_04695 [Caulobacteraceae bacterium]|jgi:hypothetical protein